MRPTFAGSAGTQATRISGGDDRDRMSRATAWQQLAHPNLWWPEAGALGGAWRHVAPGQYIGHARLQLVWHVHKEELWLSVVRFTWLVLHRGDFRRGSRSWQEHPDDTFARPTTWRPEAFWIYQVL